MANKKLSEIEKKKQELEQELAEIQSGLDKSIDDVKEGVTTNLDPKNLIRRYPLPAVGASLVLGFLLGKERKKSPRIASNRSHSYSSDSESRIASEIKRIVARKGMNLLLDYLDDKVSELKHKKQHPED
ncbi:hypothetical protein [Gracilimonas tropica]|uniref:hypothetical protein n=1 Tax=Gracilimonas tropica TaxID=454600 RepID=UPI00037053D8|nr:hypothetical protein [Gracilimonas tropica]